MLRQPFRVLLIALSFVQCVVDTCVAQPCLHMARACSPAAPASGVHVSDLSQTRSQSATLLPLPLSLPQPCMVPAARASVANTPTINAVSLFDIARDLLGDLKR